MPDRSRERSRERTDRKKIYSAVVVSKSFQKARDKRYVALNEIYLSFRDVDAILTQEFVFVSCTRAYSWCCCRVGAAVLCSPLYHLFF